MMSDVCIEEFYPAPRRDIRVPNAWKEYFDNVESRILALDELDELKFPKLIKTFSEEFGTIYLPPTDYDVILLPYDTRIHDQIKIDGSSIEEKVTEELNEKTCGSKYFILSDSDKPLVVLVKEFEYYLIWTIGELFINTQQIVFNENRDKIFFFDPDHSICMFAKRSQVGKEGLLGQSVEFWDKYFLDNFEFHSPNIIKLKQRISIHYEARFPWLRSI